MADELELEAGEEEVAEVELPEGVTDHGDFEVDVNDDPALEAEGAEGDEDTSTEQGTEAYAELRAEIEQLRRTAQEAKEFAARGGAAPAARPRVPDAPPFDPKSIETYDQLIQYLDWQRAKDRDELTKVATLEATATASAQRAAGILSKENMGAGYDYGHIVNNYIEPAVRDNPELGKVFQSMRDPALAQYGIGLVLKAIETNKGDAVKAFRQIRDALEGKRASTEDLVSKIKQAAKGQAAKSRSGKKAVNPSAGKPRLSSQLLDENGYLKLDLDEFAKKFGSRNP